MEHPAPAGGRSHRLGLGGRDDRRVKVGLERLTTTLRDPALQGAAKTDERGSMVNALIVHWFDLEEIARRSLGSHWAMRSSQEQKEFVELFGELLVSYARQMTDLSRSSIFRRRGAAKLPRSRPSSYRNGTMRLLSILRSTAGMIAGCPATS